MTVFCIMPHCDGVASYDSRSLRAHLSYVSSEPALFSMTVASNIAYRCLLTVILLLLLLHFQCIEHGLRVTFLAAARSRRL
jgi:hypothetical protein